MAEYIVDGAVLKCDQGEISTKLMVPSSRIYIGGKPAASDQDGIPMKNVVPFGKCHSGTYHYSSKVKDMGERMCVLDLMDHFYLPDESQVLSNVAEIVDSLEKCRIQIRTTIQECVNEMTEIQHLLIKEMKYEISDEIAKQYTILWKATENVHSLMEQAKEARKALAEFCAASVQNCAYLKMGNQEKGATERIEAVEKGLEDIQKAGDFLAELPKAEESHLITMESFGICRCGGILTFEESGQ